MTMNKIQMTVATLRREYAYLLHAGPDAFRALFRPVGAGDHFLPSAGGLPEKIAVTEDSVVFTPSLTILTPVEFESVCIETERLMGRQQAPARALVAEPVVEVAPEPLTAEPAPAEITDDQRRLNTVRARLMAGTAGERHE